MHRLGNRFFQRKNHGDNLKKQQQGKSQLNGFEMIGGNKSKLIA
jgi:hypothetical protein